LVLAFAVALIQFVAEEQPNRTSRLSVVVELLDIEQFVVDIAVTLHFQGQSDVEVVHYQQKFGGGVDEHQDVGCEMPLEGGDDAA